MTGEGPPDCAIMTFRFAVRSPFYIDYADTWATATLFPVS